MRAKCSYADKYKAIRSPTCGCAVCESKWKEKCLNTVIEVLAENIEGNTLTPPIENDTLTLIQEIKKIRPYLRVGQIVEVALRYSGSKSDVFMIPDETLVKGLKKILEGDQE